MGIANPRPAMRDREDRITRLRLIYHALKTGEIMARGGIDRETASSEAWCSMRAIQVHNFEKLDRKITNQKGETK